MTDTDTSEGAVVLDRTIDAPIELVWRMWTEPEHFAAWYGPDGASIPIAELDVRVGGTRRVCMQVDTPNGPMRMWFGGEHVLVDPPSRLSYTESVTAEDGTPMAPDGHPATTEVRVELEDEGGRTRLRLTHVGVPAGSPGAVGWTMALDKLAVHAAGAVR